MEVITRMLARGFIPNAITCNTAMDAAAGGQQSNMAWGLLKNMRNMGIRPNNFPNIVDVSALAGCG